MSHQPNDSHAADSSYDAAFSAEGHQADSWRWPAGRPALTASASAAIDAATPMRAASLLTR